MFYDYKLHTGKDTRTCLHVTDLLGSWNRKKESKTPVAEERGREKLPKTEQRKVQGPEWKPQEKQTTLLASPAYTGQTQGEA